VVHICLYIFMHKYHMGCEGQLLITILAVVAYLWLNIIVHVVDQCGQHIEVIFKIALSKIIS